MSGEEKTARHERAAVAYAHRLATNAGLIWREITGQDIGIDAILELPYPDEEKHGSRGFALLQVKSRAGALVGGKLGTTYRERHHLYWLTQRLPVLICVVEPTDSQGFSTGNVGYWIDYRALEPDDYSITETSDSRWTLRIPVENHHIWSTDKGKHADWSGEAKAFRGWLEKVLVKPAEAIVRTFCEAADVYLGSGKPDQAQACLGQIPIWEKVLVRASTSRSVDLLLAKTMRRMGAIEEQRKFAQRASWDGETRDILKYELALTHWTMACKTPFPDRDLKRWQKAIELVGRPSEFAKSHRRTLKRDLLGLGAYVNIRSTFSCLTGDGGDAPNPHVCTDLRELVDRWRRCEDVEITSDPRFHLQLLNALRALCRGYLSLGEVGEAGEVIEQLKKHMAAHPDRETLALTDFLLLTAWVAAESKKPERAAATLDCTRYLLKSMRDPLLEWFQDVVRAKWKALCVS